ncbi:type II toxin-antitoxin system PemK/MazF family toxin [Tsuneonella sp. SYSU-LHT278]|uniref:type II toxin-antitoxin system PemK/MazF family toxin n=1 Tax=Tsuneonella sediminis TaxID=3416089 RepID=UPI003F790E15
MKALPFHPAPGNILICDYSTGFKPPEMVKRRLCIVISPKLKRRDNLATVVPLSATCPEPLEDWNYKVELVCKSWGDGPRWAACDMLATVCYDRLSRPHYRHPVTDIRLFEKLALSTVDLDEVRARVRLALGL